MNFNKISRALIVIVFTVAIIFLNCIDVILISDNLSLKFSIFYGVIVIMLMIFYAVLKEKLYYKKVNRKVNLCYRYIYLITSVIILKLTFIYKYIDNISEIRLIFVLLASIVSAILIKKIIFNISKSDMLSVIGMILYTTIPVITVSIYNITVNLIFLFVIYLTLKIIDELKQLGIKSKKYLYLSILTGVFVSVLFLLKIDFKIIILLYLFTILIASNLDKTNINFGYKFIKNFSQKFKEFLYKIERIYIDKIFIVIFIIFSLGFGIYFIANNFIPDVNIINNNLSAFDNLKELVLSSKMFYFILFTYIILIELLNICLRRKYDTKSTMIKILFILVLIFYSKFSYSIYQYKDVISTLLIIIAIVNTSNIYLNKEERVKLLR